MEALFDRRLSLSPSVFRLVAAAGLLLAALSPASLSVARAEDDDAGYWVKALSDAPPPAPPMQPVESFPGKLRLPTRDIPLFDGLTLSGATAGRGALVGTDVTSWYRVLIANQTDDGQSQAIFDGVRGLAAYQQAARPPADCSGTACGMNGSDPDALAAYAGGDARFAEFFWVTINGRDGAVKHLGQGDAGETWSVLWFDQPSNTTYSFSLFGSAADQLSASGFDPSGHELSAQALASLASRFVAVDLNAAQTDASAPAD